MILLLMANMHLWFLKSSKFTDLHLITLKMNGDLEATVPPVGPFTVIAVDFVHFILIRIFMKFSVLLKIAL